MNALTQIINPTQSMNSLEISELVGSQHSDVKRSIERLVNKEIISQPPMADGIKAANGVTPKLYVFSGEQGKRDSIIVVAQLCPEFTGKLVDRWLELEQQALNPQPQVPQTYAEALQLAADQAKQIELISHERDQAIATKQYINDKKVASALGKVSATNRRFNNFKDERGCGNIYATINEVRKATGIKYGHYAMLKWCEEFEAEIREVPLTAITVTNAYPAQAWLEIHGLNLNEIFGEV